MLVYLDGLGFFVYFSVSYFELLVLDFMDM